MRSVRNLARMVGDLLSWGWKSGNWWIPVVAILLGAAGLLAGAAQVVVPKVAYALF